MRLLAMDADDLQTISAAAQDALFLAEGAYYSAANRTFTLEINRFRWESDDKNQRVKSALSFASIINVKALGIEIKSNIPKSILSIDFVPDTEPPGGVINLELAGGDKFSIQVECVDVILGDIGAPIDVKNRPNHDGDK